MNIVGNALKYTESGYILAKLRVEDKPRANGRPSESHVILSVADTGRGISERYLKHRLYVPFAQEDNLSVGVGLGLSIVNRLIVDLGGHIHIDSQVGIGTNVVMTIPSQSKIQRPGTPLQDRNIRPASHTQLRQRKEVLCFEGFDGGQGSTLQSARAEHLNDLALLKLKQVLTQLAETWLNTKVTTTQDEATIFIIEESRALSILQSDPENALFKKKYILISRSELLNTNSTRWKGCYNRIVTPIGPIKLARVLATIIQQGTHDDDSTSPESQVVRTGSDLPEIPVLQGRPHPQGERKSSPSPLTTKMGSPEVCRILLVDDNDINVRILANLVRKLHFPFATASNGQEALDQYIVGHEEGHPFQVIFMDISMPVMDGLTATRRIRTYEMENSISKPVDVFALTGLGQENTREEATASGVDQYFLKPVKLDLLRELLKDREIAA